MKKKLICLMMGLFITTSTFAQVDRSQPKPGPAPKVNIGKPQSFKMSNGLTVLVVENHKLPKITATLTIDNPPFAEGSKVGVSTLTSGLMGNGTSKVSKDKYLEEIEFYGADVNMHINGGYVSAITKYFPRVLELMAQGAIDPLFTQEELDKQRNQLIEGLKADEKSVATIANKVQKVLTYGKHHPYGEFMTEESLKNISLADIKSHYANFFSPNNAYLIITGDITLKDAKKLVEKHFKPWKKGNSPKIEYPDPKDVQYTQINFIDVPHASQTEIALKNVHKLQMSDKDYFAVLLANQILGGGGEGYLFLNLRETHGWTYGAYSSIRPTRYVGDFTASASVRTQATDSAVVEFLKEIKRIRTEKVSAEDLANAKAKYVGNFVMQMEKPQTVARYALNTLLYKLPDTFYQNFIASVNAVTAEDIQRVAQKYFSLDNSRIVVVGKGSEVLSGLEKLNIPIFYFDKDGNHTEKPQTKTVDPSITPTVVLDAYIKAVGGADNLKKVNTIYQKAEVSVPGAPAPVTVIIKRGVNKFAQEISMAGMGTLQKAVINGNKGYMMAQGQRTELKEDEVKEFFYEVNPTMELTIRDNKDVTIKGIENIDGKDAYALKFKDYTFYYDTVTGLKLAEAKEVEVMGQKMSQMTYYKDYRDIKGVKIAYNIVQNVGFDLDMKFSEVKINEGVTDADFK